MARRSGNGCNLLCDGDDMTDTTENWIAFQNSSQEGGQQWSIGIENAYGIHGVGEGERYMLVSGFCTEEEARMMAASRELLDALKGLLASAHDYQSGIDDAISAIVKATGQ